MSGATDLSDLPGARSVPFGISRLSLFESEVLSKAVSMCNCRTNTELCRILVQNSALVLAKAPISHFPLGLGGTPF
jgi:hypothetical protein